MAETLTLKGTMQGHTDMVTAIATPIDNSDTIVTSSRDKSILVWTLTKDAANAAMDLAAATYGVPRRRLTGHSHFVQDVVLSSDGQFAVSGSWDGELRLWDLSTGSPPGGSELSDPVAAVDKVVSGESDFFEEITEQQ